MIGDLLITFGGEAEGCLSRTGKPWAPAAVYGAVHMYTTPPDELWHGFPLVEFEDANWRIWLLGELYEEAEPLPLALAQPEKLNGNYLLIGYEKEQERMHVVTNRLGTLHCYHALNGEKAALGTFSPAVAQAAGCSALDLQAVAEFFSFGFFLGSATHWQGVNLLPAATHTVLDEKGRLLSREPYWRWRYEPSDHLTYDETIDQFHELFRTVLTSQVSQKRIALPLSGGLDSRSTLAELGEVGLGGAAQIFPYSYGYSGNSVETKIARQLGEKRGMDVRTWIIQPYLFDQLERISASVEGFQDVTQCRQAYVVDELAQQAENVVAAHWGDVWLDDMGFLGQGMLPDEALAEILVKKYMKDGSDLLQSLFAANLTPGWKEAVNDKVRMSLSGLEEIRDLDFKVKAWKTSQWSFRWTVSSLRMFQAGLFPLLPFYDNRLIDFFMQVPGAFTAGRRLQIDYLKRFAPDLAKVKWQPYDADLFHYQAFNTWQLPRRAVRKLGRSLSGKPIIQRNWEAQFLNAQGQAGLAKYLLEPGLKLHTLISLRDVEQLLTDFYQNPTSSRGYAVSMLLTFSTWLEQYG